MSYILHIFLLILSVAAFIIVPYLLISDYRLRKRETPVFDALVARVKESDKLTRDELITLHDELVDWSKRTDLYTGHVVRYLSYLRGRIGVKPL